MKNWNIKQKLYNWLELAPEFLGTVSLNKKKFISLKLNIFWKEANNEFPIRKFTGEFQMILFLCPTIQENAIEFSRNLCLLVLPLAIHFRTKVRKPWISHLCGQYDLAKAHQSKFSINSIKFKSNLIFRNSLNHDLKLILLLWFI